MGGNPHLADLLPGALFGQLTPRPTLQRLPAAEIPQPIRDQDSNLKFTPTIGLDTELFTISFGDRNLVIGCKLPYPKWPTFKQAILECVSKVARVGIEGPVERYSIKYVNLIQAPTSSAQIAKINMAIRVGDVEATDDHLSVKVHKNEGDTLHIMSVVTNAEAKMPDGETIVGAVVDIDSIRNMHFADFGEFATRLEPELESLRQANKVKFFNCLTESTISEMGPKYD